MESPYTCYICNDNNKLHTLLVCACCQRNVCIYHFTPCYSKDIFVLYGEVDSPSKQKFKKTVKMNVCDKCLGITNKVFEGNSCTCTIQK